jgi:diguanylate cyclase (GGDEF)-like protein/PAS domain S-box-containing protein
MHRVSAGDLSQVVPVKGKDELASMAAGFNGVLEDLRHTYSVWQNEHDKLQTILSGSRDGIVVTDASGRIVMVNPAATVLLEKSTKAIVGNGFDALLDQPDRMREMLASETTTAEVMAYGQRVLALSVAAIRTDDRRLIGKAAILRDITEGKRMEQMLRTLSHTDGLTGLANRRMLDETLKTEVARAQSLPRDLSLMMFDIDHFKKFNDEFGHAQGDRVLKAVAEVAKNSVRNVDTACRYGGEEFVVILTETPLEGALILAERLRESVQNLRADGLQVTISVGVAGWCESGPTDPQELLSLADRALYISKNSGRNRVTAAPSKFAPVSDQGNDCL